MNRIPPSPSDPQGWWVPNHDVYVGDDGHLVVEVELAAMNREDLELTIKANRLIIRGERPDERRRKQSEYLVHEINHGPFQSVVEIPPGYDLARARAAYKNGLLRIEVPLKTDGARS